MAATAALPREVELEETHGPIGSDDVQQSGDDDARSDEELLPSADEQVLELFEAQRRTRSRRRKAVIVSTTVIVLVLIGVLIGEALASTNNTNSQGPACYRASRNSSYEQRQPVVNTQQTRHVVLLGFDGLKPDGLNCARTPNIDRLVAGGAYTYNARACIPTISGPNWAAILGGVGPVGFGFMSNENTTYSQPLPGLDPKNISIFSVLKRAGLTSLLINTNAGYCDWFGNYLSMGDVSSVVCNSAPTENKATYDSTMRAGLARMTAMRPALTFIYFDQPDGTGHDWNWGSQQYIDAISMVDGYTGLVVDTLRQSGMLAETTLLVVTDHGGEDGHDYHGMYTNACLKVPWIAWGAGIRPRRLVSAVRHLDTAPMIVRLLSSTYGNVGTPQGWEGRPINEALLAEQPHIGPTAPTPLADRAVVVVVDRLSWRNLGIHGRSLAHAGSSTTARSVGAVRSPETPYSSLVLDSAMDTVPLLWAGSLEELGFGSASMWLAADRHNAPYAWPTVFDVAASANVSARLFAVNRSTTSWAFDLHSQLDCVKMQDDQPWRPPSCGVAADKRFWQASDSDDDVVAEVVSSIERNALELTLVRITTLLDIDEGLTEPSRSSIANVDDAIGRIAKAVGTSDSTAGGTALFVVGTHAQATWGEVCAMVDCGWTQQWACPPAHGKSGTAGDDGSQGFLCCCKLNSTKARSLYPGAVQSLTRSSVGVPWIVILPRGQREAQGIAGVPVQSQQTVATALAVIGVATPDLWAKPAF